MTLLNICYKRNEINPLIPWVQLVGGFMCAVTFPSTVNPKPLSSGQGQILACKYKSVKGPILALAFREKSLKYLTLFPVGSDASQGEISCWLGLSTSSRGVLPPNRCSTFRTSHADRAPVLTPTMAAGEREENNLNDFQRKCTENGSSPGQSQDFTGLCVPSLLDSGHTLLALTRRDGPASGISAETTLGSRQLLDRLSSVFV